MAKEHDITSHEDINATFGTIKNLYFTFLQMKNWTTITGA
jgi:hypothetical protein